MAAAMARMSDKASEDAARAEHGRTCVTGYQWSASQLGGHESLSLPLWRCCAYLPYALYCLRRHAESGAQGFISLPLLKRFDWNAELAGEYPGRRIVLGVDRVVLEERAAVDL